MTSSSTTPMINTTGDNKAFENDPNRDPNGRVVLTGRGMTNFDLFVGEEKITTDGHTIALTYGTLTINPHGRWSYSVDNANAEFNSLNFGQTRTEMITFKYRPEDSSADPSAMPLIDPYTHTHTITIHGSTDREISGGVVDYSLRTEAVTIRLIGAEGTYREGTLKGGSGDDRLYGFDKNDQIEGNDGADRLAGGAGNDTLTGGAGNDLLDGGAGSDILTGGAGNDWFTLYQGELPSVDETKQNPDRVLDVVTDFVLNEDKIKIDVSDGDFTTLSQLRSTLKIRIANEHKATITTNDAGVKDTVIYATRGTLLKMDDDVALMVLVDTGNAGNIDDISLTHDHFTTAIATTSATINLADLTSTTGFRLVGESPDDWSGHSVSSAGDVNGDGYDDIIIGAYHSSSNGSSSGASYIVYGKVDGYNADIDLGALVDSDGVSIGFRLVGESANDFSGHSVSSAGDVNGDGYDDIIIGAYRADPNGVSNSGSSYVVFGKESGFSRVIGLSALDGSDGFRVDGANAGDTSGYSVSSAGDVNGDGYDDIIIGAYQADPNGVSNSGSSYVVFGKKSDFDRTIELSALDGSDGFRLVGESPGDWSGISVSSAGDINGDRIDDIIIGARNADPNGRNVSGSSYVVFGKKSDFNATINLSAIARGEGGFRIDGERLGDKSGDSVSSAGDINGDGYDDIIIGAYSADYNGRDGSGSSYVVFGKESGFSSGAINLATIVESNGRDGFRIDGESSTDWSGASVSSAGDFNGDGYDDIIIGAPEADYNGSYSGSSYVVFGKKSDFNATINLSDIATGNGRDGVRLDGESTDDISGYSVSSAGDINGDGYDDIIIGAWLAGEGDSGSSYIIYGYATSVSIEGEAYVGETLTTRGGPSEKTAEYLWKRYHDNTVEVIGTGRDYTLTDDDIGRTIKVEVNFIDVNGDREHYYSEATPVVAKINIVIGTDSINHPDIVQIGTSVRGEIGTVSGTDPLGRAITYKLSEDTPNYYAIDVNTGEITLTEGYDFMRTATHDIGIIASVGGVELETYTRSIKVNAVIGIAPPPEHFRIVEGETVSVELVGDKAIDADGDVLQFKSVARQATGSDGHYTVVGGVFEWTPIGGFVGEKVISNVIIEDSVGGERLTTITVTVDATVSIEGEAYVGETLTAVGSPAADNAGYIWKRYHDNGTFDPIGTMQKYTLTDADADKTIRVEVSLTNSNGVRVQYLSDATPDVEKIDIVIGTDSINHPDIVQIGTSVMDEIGTVSGTDPLGRPITYALSDNPNDYYAIDANTGVITLAEEYKFEDTVTHDIGITATVGGADLETYTRSIKVNAVIVEEDITKEFFEGDALRFPLERADVDGDTLRFKVQEDQISNNDGHYTVVGGVLEWTPTSANFAGLTVISNVAIEDDAGGETSEDVNVNIIVNGIDIKGGTEVYEDNPFRGNPAGRASLFFDGHTSLSVMGIDGMKASVDTGDGIVTSIDLNYGQLRVQANGEWSYVLDNTNTVFTTLNNGDTLTMETITFIYRTINSPERDLMDTHTITIHGATDYDPAPGSPAVFQGGADDDVITGTEKANQIHGNGGDDWLFGGRKHDRFYIDLGEGEDVIDGGAGNTDVLHFNASASSGNLAIRFDMKDDTKWKFDTSVQSWNEPPLVADQNNDDYTHRQIWVDTNGNGNKDEGDKYHYLTNVELLNFVGSNGNDAIKGGDGIDKLHGGKGNDDLDGGGGNDKLTGGRGNDVLDGGGGNDELIGNKGNDVLDGGGGNDELIGNKGNDVLDGGSGANTLTGGEGADTFVLNQGSDAEVYFADVVDFRVSGENDKILVKVANRTIADSIITAEDALLAVMKAANITWRQDSNTDDTIIMSDVGNNQVLMVLQDYTETLSINDFEIAVASDVV